MKLYASKTSHFARKVRLVMDHLDLDYELEPVANVAVVTPGDVATNPMRSVPVLVDGDVTMFESDHIAQYLVQKHDPEDSLGVLASDPEALNIRAVLNGIMANEVKLVLAKRTGIEPKGKTYFDKALACIEDGLSWLEQRADRFAGETVDYEDFHFISSWDHLVLFDILPMSFPRLAAAAEKLGEIPEIEETAPPPFN